MNDNYLWDRSGEPDPEIQKLETALGRFRYQAQTPEFPQYAPPLRPRFWPMAISLSWPLRLVSAAIFLAAILGFLKWRQTSTANSGPVWEVESIAGTPHVESGVFGKSSQRGVLGIGQTLVTDDHSRANISVAAIGTVSVAPNSRLRLLRGGKAHNRLALDRGTIDAFIWAMPGEFTVDTPSAIAVDLGCSYTLHVDDSGAGLLRTKLGWVGFKLDGHEAFIPAGAVCATRPKLGPGTPYFEDASESFRQSLSLFDFSAGASSARVAALDKILAEARQRDALTIWHLLARVDDSERSRVYDRLAALVPPPPGVSREGIVRLDQTMLDAWWNQLGLGDISLWRTWERSWSQDKT